MKKIYFILFFIILNSIAAQDLKLDWGLPHNRCDWDSSQFMQIISDDNLLIAVISDPSYLVKIYEKESGRLIFMKDFERKPVEIYFTDNNKSILVMMQWPYKIVIEEIEIEIYREINRFEIDTVDYVKAKLSGNLDYLVLTDAQRQVHFWDYKTETLVNSLNFAYASHDFTFAKDSNYIITAGLTQISILSYPEGKLIRSFDAENTSDAEIYLCSDNKYIGQVINGSDDISVNIYDYQTGELKLSKGFYDDVYWGDLNPDTGNFLLICEDEYITDKEGIFEYNPEDTLYERKISGSLADCVNYIDYDDEKDILISSAALDIIDYNTLEIKKSFNDTLWHIVCGLTADASEMMICHDTMPAEIYDAENGEFLRYTQYPAEKYSPKTNQYLFLEEETGDNPWKLKFIDYDSEEILNEFDCYNGCELEYVSEDLHYLSFYIYALDQRQILDTQTGNFELTIADGEYLIGFSLDCKYYLTYVISNEERFYKVYSLENNSLSFQLSNDNINAIHFHNTSGMLMYVTNEMELVEYDFENGMETNRFGLTIEGIDRFYGISKDSRYAVLAADREIFIYDIESKRPADSILVYDYSINSVTISDDFRKLILRYYDNSIACVDLSCITGIEETNKQNSGLHVFPNPATDKITINYTSTQIGNFTLKIYSNLGNLIENISSEKTGEEFTLDVDVSEYTPGIYWAELFIGNETFSMPFVVVGK